MTSPTISTLPVSSLKEYRNNPRTHSARQVEQLARSIEEFGFNSPILVDENQQILAGHGRLEAARKLGLEEVPCLLVDQLTETQKRAFIIADNKIASNAGWDLEILSQELEIILSDGEPFDIELTGFTLQEIDAVIEDVNFEDEGDPAEDALPATTPERRVQPGQIWSLGPHRLVCGSCLEEAAMDALLEGQKAVMGFTDPPYNVPISGHVSGKGKTTHREFAQASGEMSNEQFRVFLSGALQALANHSVDGSIHYVFMDWRHLDVLLSVGKEVYDELKNIAVWVKNNAGMGSFYRSQHEMVAIFKNGAAPHINNFELGQHGRHRSNVWPHAGVNTFRAGRMEELGMHPTVKPVDLVAHAIRDVSGRGDIVLDVFGGSGSTLVAAHKTGRRAFLVEIDPLYCDTILARYEAYAHDDAVLLGTLSGCEEGVLS